MSCWQLALFVCATGCTATHVVTLPPLETKHPVSASAEYVDPEGALVGPQDYRVVLPFQLTKVERSHGADFESQLQLGPELERLVQAADGNAITKLRIEATSFTMHENVGTVLGLSLGIVGSILLLQDLVSHDDERTRPGAVFWTGSACFATGGIMFIVGDFTRATSWQLHVSGQVVRPASTPEPPAAL